MKPRRLVLTVHYFFTMTVIRRWKQYIKCSLQLPSLKKNIILLSCSLVVVKNIYLYLTNSEFCLLGYSNTHTTCKLHEDPRWHKCSSKNWYTMAKKIQVISDEKQDKPWVDCGVHFRHQYLTTEIWPIYLQAPNINFASHIWLLRQIKKWRKRKYIPKINKFTIFSS